MNFIKSKVFALGRLKAGEMNATEKWYANILYERKLAGEVLWYGFDCINLRLSKGAHYRPDFFVLTSTFELQVHETKGHWQDDALVKIKVAAEMYPFIFFAIRKVRGLVEIREVGEDNLTSKINKVEGK